MPETGMNGNMFRAVHVVPLTEPGPMVRIQEYETAESAIESMQHAAGGVVLNPANEVIYEKGANA